MKVGPVLRAMRSRLPADRHVLIHTGQHYDHEMSRVFLEDLQVPEPDHHLDVGSADPSSQTARMMEGVGSLLAREAPQLVVVAGDVNSTLAAALAAAKLDLRVAHLESGLRSFDRSMPEELNRVLVDRIADLLLIHSPEARDNLLAEGAGDESIYMVGNTMIDTLVGQRPTAQGRLVRERYGLRDRYLLVTLHRPALLGELLAPTLRALETVAEEIEVVFPVHPRTQAHLEGSGDDRTLREAGVHVSPPLGYLDFLGLEAEARFVATDSGGVQEETSFLGVRCFTFRDSNERLVTEELGTNTRLGAKPERLAEIPELLQRPKPGDVIPGWDGAAGGRAAEVLRRALG